MLKTITVVLELDLEEGLDVECEDDLQRVFDSNRISSYGGTDTFGVTVTNFVEGDALAKKPPHFSDRELSERGLPEYCFALEPSTGDVIYLERGMLGYIPQPEYGKLDSVDHLNEELGVTPAQASAMLAGSMFGWHVPAADPNHRFNKED